MATELIYSTQLQFAKINSSKSIKTAKNFDQNQKPHAKPSKPINFHISVLKTLIDPIQC